MLRPSPKLGSKLAALCCATTLYASACAMTEPESSNGQTHWLRSCVHDGDCGDLSCECGVCTIKCSTSASCTAISGMVCRNASTLATADECEGKPESTKLCLRPDRTSSTDTGTAADAASPDAEAEHDAGADRDARIVPDAEAGAMDASEDATVTIPIDSGNALHVACDVIEAGALPTEVVLIQTASDNNFGVLSASGHGLAWYDGEGTHYRLSDTASIQTIVDAMQQPVLEGTDLFFHAQSTVSKRTLENGNVVELASEPSVSFIQALTPTTDALYWAGRDASDSALTHIWRSEREPGVTREIDAIRADPPYAMAVLGGYLYFARATTGNTVFEISRVLEDGSAPTESLSAPIENLGNIISDGTSLFGTISAGDSSAGPAPSTGHRVVRIGKDGSVSTLFETHKIWWYPAYISLVADDTYLYWVAHSSSSTTEQSIWRGRKDGQGEPVQLIEGLPDGETFLASGATSLYLAMYCTHGVPILGIDKPR